MSANIPTESLFTFEDVSLSYGETQVLKSINLDIGGRGITAIVGRSGSGKSSLLRLCNRLSVPTTGRVLFGGVDLADLDVLEHRRRVGMASQKPALFAGDVASNLLVAQPDASVAELTKAIGQLGLDATFLNRDVDELSGGEAQRVSVARTLIAGPEVLLADESTSAVDQETRELIERHVRSLADDGMPVLWVTHDLARVETFADNIVEIADGQIVCTRETGQNGPPSGDRP